MVELEKLSTFDILCNYISWAMDFPGGSVVKNLYAMQEMQETRVQFWVRKIPWRRAWQPIPVFLPGESQGQRILVGYNPESRRVGHH